VPPQPSLPQESVAHDGIQTLQLPLRHIPLPALVEQRVVDAAFVVPHVPPLQTPSRQPSGLPGQSLLLAHWTHCPAPTQCALLGQAVAV
jgi:hypothetical protein